jgi:hypothetical protein
MQPYLHNFSHFVLPAPLDRPFSPVPAGGAPAGSAPRETSPARNRRCMPTFCEPPCTPARAALVRRFRIGGGYDQLP